MLRRHVAPVAILFAAVIAVAVTTVVAAADRRGTADRALTQSVRVLGTSAEIERHVIDLETGVRGFLATGDRLFLEPWSAARAALPGEFAHLSALLSDQPRQQQSRAELQQAVNRYMTGYATPLLSSSGFARGHLDGSLRSGKRLMDGLRARFTAFSTAELALQHRAEHRVAAAEQTFSVVGIAAALGLLAALLGVVLYLRWVVVAPLRRAIAACAAVAKADRGTSLSVAGAPELRELASAFNAMLAELECRRAALDATRAQADEAAALYRTAVETAHHAYVAIDEHGAVTAWNSAAERMFGYSGPEAIGRDLSMLILPERHREAHGARLRGGGPPDETRPGEGSWQVSALRRDGTEFRVEITASVAEQARGQVVHAFIADISDRLTAEADQRLLSRELAEAAERQRLLLDSLPDTVVALCDRDLKYLLLQGPILARLGIDATDFVGRSIEHMLTAEQQEQIEPLIRRALKGEAVAVEYTSAFTGLTYTVDVAPYRLPDGTIAGAFAVGRDVSDRLAGESERRRLATIVEQSSDAIAGSNMDGVLTEWNRGAELLYGYTAHEAIGQPAMLLMPPGRRREGMELLARVLAGETVQQFETERVRRDGTVIDVSMTVSLIRDPAGTPLGQSVVTRDITARKLAERKLRDQARLLAESQAVTHIGSWEWDLTGSRLAWSDELCRICGQPPGFSPTVEEFMTMVHPDDRAGVSAGVADAQGGNGSASEYRIRRLDGVIRVTAGRRFARTNERGEVTHLFGTTQDVTEQRLAERERERAASQLAEAQRIARIGSWSWDPEADVATWSEEMYRIFGRDPSQGPATKEALFEIVHPEDRDWLAAGYTRAFGSGTEFELDYRIVRADGSERVLHGLGRQDGNGAGHYVGTVQDVTELRAVERGLRAAEQRFRKALEYAPIGMALVSPVGQWLQVNRALCELVGYREDELLALTFQDITHPGDLDADLEFVRQLLAGEASSYRMQKRYLHRSGPVVWAELSVSLVRDDDGAPVHFISQIQDISAERAAREALQESEGRYQSIAANVPGMVYRFTMSPDGEFALPFASAGAREIYGVEPEQLTADVRLALDGIPAEDRERFAASVATSARELTHWEWHGQRLTRDGEVKYLHATAQPSREPDGTILWDGVLLDETAIRRAQHQEAHTTQRLELILQNLAGSAVVLYDRELRLRFCEGPLFAHLDMSEMLGRPLPEFVSEEIMDRVGPGIERALAGEVSTAVLDHDREGRTLAIQFAPYRLADGTIDGSVVHWQDISTLTLAERERDEALALFQVAFERAPIGLVIVGLNGRFQRVNDALCEITGYSGEDLLAMAPFAIVSPEDLDQVQQHFAQVGVLHDSMTFEHRVAHATGHLVWVQVRVTMIRDERDRPVHVLAQVQDISDRRSYEDRLRHMADHDPLTGLLNRRGLERALEGHLAHCRRYGVSGALLMLDLDGFKFVNDTLGHAVGDELIINCAHALTGRLRETDTIARLGGDEFAILLPTENRQQAETVAQALIDTVREQTAAMSNAHPGRVTASIGVAMFSDTASTAEEMLINADLAMYDAKDAGRNRYSLHSREEHAIPKIQAQMTWMQRIERALAEERFVLYAQPIIDMRTRRTVQHEVLVRMLDEHGDLIPPNTFLYIAERFGLIQALDRWIITQAIRTMASQQAQGRPLPLAVNISGHSTGDPDTLDAISRELRVANIPAGDLTLEITETAAVADIPRARRFADALADIGCRFALDDFGAGFGSFYYLKHLPFDVIKIDGEFVRHATENAADRLVIKAVSDIAHGLGKQTVAEFVPDEATIRLLQHHGVDLAQGYYLGRPAPLADILAPRALDVSRVDL